jgi:hypothetical protein
MKRINKLILFLSFFSCKENDKNNENFPNNLFEANIDFDENILKEKIKNGMEEIFFPNGKISISICKLLNFTSEKDLRIYLQKQYKKIDESNFLGFYRVKELGLKILSNKKLDLNAKIFLLTTKEKKQNYYLFYLDKDNICKGFMSYDFLGPTYNIKELNNLKKIGKNDIKKDYDSFSYMDIFASNENYREEFIGFPIYICYEKEIQKYLEENSKENKTMLQYLYTWNNEKETDAHRFYIKNGYENSATSGNKNAVYMSKEISTK